MTSTITSVAGVVDVMHVGDQSRAVDVVVEVPHGATLRSHFDALRAQLVGPFPDDLVDFFFVNTDVGAPEAAVAFADHLARAAGLHVVVLRCLIPRTFVDCNRVIDGPPQPTASTATGMTPGVVRYVTDAADLALLYARYSAYRELVTRVLGDVCGGGGGMAVMLHSYAPRSVDVPVDEKIVERLRAAYAPEVEPTWPLRPEVDLITTTPDGAMLADAALIDAVRAEFTSAGVAVADSTTYPLHPSSLAHVFASQ